MRKFTCKTSFKMSIYLDLWPRSWYFPLAATINAPFISMRVMYTFKRDRYTPTYFFHWRTAQNPCSQLWERPFAYPDAADLPKRTDKTEITPAPYLHKNKSTSSIHSVVSVGTHRSQQPIAPQRHSRRHGCIFVIRSVERQAYKWLSSARDAAQITVA